MSDDNTKRWGVEINAELHEALDKTLEHGERSEILRNVARELVTGDFDAYTINDIKIAMKDSELEDAREEVRMAQARVERLESERDKLINDREQIETDEDRYDGALWSLEQQFRGGEVGHITPKSGEVRSISSEFDISRSEVVDELRDRNPDIPEKAFESEESYRELNSTPDVFSGLPDEQVAVPAEDRHE